MIGTGDGGTDAGAGADLVAKDFEWPLHLLQDAARHHLKIVRRDNVLDQYSKLVSAESRSGVLRAQASAQAAGSGDEQSIAGGVAKTVIDFLEFVEVDIEDPAALGRDRAGGG